MALTVNTNYGATGTTDHPAGTVSRQVANLNWLTDWGLKSATSSEVVLVNRLSPRDAKNKIRFSVTDVANVYTNSGIQANYQLPSRQGISLLAQATAICDVLDSSDAQFHAQLPLSAHLVLRAPKSGLLTTAQIMGIVQQLVGSLYPTDGTVNTTAGLDNLLNGLINPLQW